MLDGIKTAVRKMTGKATGNIPTYDMSSKAAREHQVKHDFEYAKTERAEQTSKMITLNNYYNGKMYSKRQVQEISERYGWNSTPPVLPYPYIHVETAIDDSVPQFQFRGRDDKLDPERAKVREAVVNYIMYINKVRQLNLDNERALNEIGNAFWKVAFDGSVTGPGWQGDIVIGNPDPANIFPDPSAYDIEDCEFIIYAFRMHRRKARRIFGKIMDSIPNDSEHGDTEIYETAGQRTVHDDTVQVVEYWYRDDEGDIACSVQVSNIEVKHIKKYWQDTRFSGNKSYPFVKYCKIPVRKSFWDRGEIETIMDLCDAANREFFTAIVNDMFMANDIVLLEKDAMENEPSALPGAKWEVKPGRINSVRRLGGVSQNNNLLEMIKFIQERIEETNGNWAAKGPEPKKVTTASGLAQIREDRDARQTVKKADRLEGFARLAELIDWTALEFYNQDRIIMIRGEKEGEPDTSIVYNSQYDRVPIGFDEFGEPTEFYYPRIDVEISAGDGIQKSKAFTLAATQELANMNINPVNSGIVMSIIDLLDLPNKDEVKESIAAAIQQQMQPPPQQQPPPEAGGGIPPELQPIFDKLPPEVQQTVMQLPPDQQVAFLSQPPEEIMADIEQLIQGGGTPPMM